MKILVVIALAEAFHNPLTVPGRSSVAVAGKKNRRRKLEELTDPGLQKIGGITAPTKDDVPKGWEIGEARLVGVKRGPKLFVMEAACSRCSWDLDRGTVEGDEICCPLCGQCYDLRTGKPGKAIDRGFLGNLAKNAPTTKKATTANTVTAAIDDGIYLDCSEGSYLGSLLKS